MKNFRIWMATICFIVSTGPGFAQPVATTLDIKAGHKNVTYRLNGPYSHNNLSVYLIQGSDQAPDKKIISLEEAIEKGMVRIDETGDVNSLSARNLSSEYHVLIQSGDIVKGGKQDRTIGRDVVLSPKSGKVPLDAFCVEQGRWQPRGKETANQFSSAKKQLSSKKLKLAAKQAKSQQAVWQAVEEEQANLSRKVGKSVKSQTSATSLQLTLEDKAVQAKVTDYIDKLLPEGLKQDATVGFACVINGEFNSADIYATRELFKQVWYKSLEAAACESVSMFETSAVYPQPSLQAVGEHIANGLTAAVQQNKTDHNIRHIARDSKESVAYETLDDKGETIHLNVLHK